MIWALGILCGLLAVFSLVLLVQNHRLRGLSGPSVPVEASPLSARPDNPDYALFLKLEELLDGGQLYLDPSLDRERLCGLLGIEKNRMGRLIRVYSGCDNLSAYVNGKRIRHACTLMLQHPEWTLQAVAESSGIPSIATFNRAFRAARGLSPTAWLQRERLQELHRDA